jgi:UDP-N-acetyl-D-galactosamine dehydrogenase
MYKDKIAIIGLGYVGLPLAAAFAKEYDVIGFDINASRIKELQRGYDRTLELSSTQLSEVQDHLSYSASIEELRHCNIFIVTVPTPIDESNRPDLTPLIRSSQSIATILKKDDLVIYESTVYPGVTEEVCVPELQKASGLIFNQDFFCGYSPERINPGDKKHTVTKIRKVTSGSTPEAGARVDAVYKSIITAGTYLAASIKVAEAAKVIENAQRDINIAFVNELAIIFNKLDIDTTDVLEAAATKWNFLPFKPGLVGGHCIGVDPYYLTQKAQDVGYDPKIILAGRQLNDTMGIYIVNQVLKLMMKKEIVVNQSRVLVLGITFKENCPDIRNSRVIDVIQELQEFGCKVTVTDYWADKEEVKYEYELELCNDVNYDEYEAVVLAVAHDKFKQQNIGNKNQIVFDIKSILDSSDGRL